MEKKNENQKIEELTDEQMKNVVGGSDFECFQMEEECHALPNCWEQKNCFNNLKQQYGCRGFEDDCRKTPGSDY